MAFVRVMMDKTLTVATKAQWCGFPILGAHAFAVRTFGTIRTPVSPNGLMRLLLTMNMPIAPAKMTISKSVLDSAATAAGLAGRAELTTNVVIAFMGKMMSVPPTISVTCLAIDGLVDHV